MQPEYHERNVFEQLLDWLDRLVDDTVDAASQRAAAVDVRGDGRVPRAGDRARRCCCRARAVRPGRRRSRGAVLTDETRHRRELRERAERALAEGRNADAVVDGFRALTVRQVERGRLDDLPGATAHEVATAVGAVHPGQRHRVDGTAALFDSVLYGDRPATPEQAVGVLELDDALAGRS